MIDRLLNLPLLFWQRLLIILFGYFGAVIGKNYLPIPPFVDSSLVFSVLFVLFIATGVIFFKTVKIPFLSYAIAQLIFIWMLLDQFLINTVHLSLKPHALVFGFVILAAVYYFFKNLNFLWNFNTFKFLLLFFMANIFYYFFHYSTFNIVSIGDIYNWTNYTEAQDAKTIVFLDSLAVFCSSILALSVFGSVNSKEQVNKIFSRLLLILSIAFLIITPVIPLIGGLKGAGYQIFFSIYLIFILGLKYFIDNNVKISEKYNTFLLTALILLGGMTLLSCNKSALVSIFISVFILAVINYRLNITFNIFSVLKNKRFGLLFWILIAFVLIFLAAKFNIVDNIFSKIHDILNSFQGISSLYIRKANWKYFMQYWDMHGNIFNTLFGFGIGKSREIMFYSSAMLYSNIYLVQTTHNQYMEMFFDYGAVAMFYYIPLIIIGVTSVRNLINPKTDKNIKLLSNISVAILLFYILYHFTDGLRVPSAIIIFASLMFLEAAKYSIAKINSAE
jgi:hypothetical protein